MSILFMLVSLALAGAGEDLSEASDAELGLTARMAAFDRLVQRGTTDITLVQQVAADPDGDARERWVAVRVLGQVGGPAARSVLLSLLSDKMPAMRAAAVQALGDLGDITTTQQVIPLLDDPAVIVRAGAAEALGKLRSAGAVDPLATALMSGRSYYRGSSLWVRRHYVEALGAIGDAAAVAVLARCLDDSDETVQVAAVGALGQVAGFDFADGRDFDEQRAAWRRWAQAR